MLPQSLRLVVPAIMNTFIGTFKDTSLVTIVSLYDLTGALQLALGDSDWRKFFLEGQLFVAADLFRLLLRDVALQPVGRAASQHRHPPSIDATEATHAGDRTHHRVLRASTSGTAQFHVLRDIDLSVARGERIVICGPSGSGKSTLIRCINRLEEHQQGVLKVDGVELTDDLKAIEAIRRRSGWCSSSSTCSRT